MTSATPFLNMQGPTHAEPERGPGNFEQVFLFEAVVVVIFARGAAEK